MKKTFEQITDDFYSYSLGKCQAHYDMAEKYKRMHQIFGMVVVVVTALVGTSTFIALTGSTSRPVQVATAVLSVAAVVLSALQTFLGFADLQSKHQIAGVGYAQARRSLELLALEYPSGQGAAESREARELEDIKKLLDDLDKASPTIPNTEWDRVWAKISRKKKSETR
jgi:hypothetical protein